VPIIRKKKKRGGLSLSLNCNREREPASVCQQFKPLRKGGKKDSVRGGPFMLGEGFPSQRKQNRGGKRSEGGGKTKERKKFPFRRREGELFQFRVSSIIKRGG